MLVGLDATPLLGRRTGIGRYVGGLLPELVRPAPDAGVPPVDVVATAFSLRGRGELAALLPDGVRDRSRPAPARLLQGIWSRTEWPTVTSLIGRVDVFHGTNFVLPPPGRARGVVTVHDLAFLHSPGTVSATSQRLPRPGAPRAVPCGRRLHAVAGRGGRDHRGVRRPGRPAAGDAAGRGSALGGDPRSRRGLARRRRAPPALRPVRRHHRAPQDAAHADRGQAVAGGHPGRRGAGGAARPRGLGTATRPRRHRERTGGHDRVAGGRRRAAHRRGGRRPGVPLGGRGLRPAAPGGLRGGRPGGGVGPAGDARGAGRRHRTGEPGSAR